MTLSRRQMLAGAAGAVAGAALPAAAVAPSITKTFAFEGISEAALTIDEWAAQALKLESLEMTVLVSPLHKAVLKQMLVEHGHPEIDVETIKWTPFRSGLVTRYLGELEDDPVLHPEGREDPTEWA